jgi:hypothetical protein
MGDGKYESRWVSSMTTFLFTVAGVSIGVCAVASMVIVGQGGKQSELKKAAEVVASVAGIVLAIGATGRSLIRSQEILAAVPGTSFSIFLRRFSSIADWLTRSCGTQSKL